MKTELKNDHSDLLADIWKLHSLLNTVWPNPNVPEMAGASTFIGTNFFNSLETGIRRIDEKLALMDARSEAHKILDDFWAAFTRLYLHLKTQKRGEKSEKIDYEFNLLYLASGVFYHLVKEISSTPLKLDPCLSEVEDMAKLLDLCKWVSTKATVTEIGNELMGAMDAQK